MNDAESVAFLQWALPRVGLRWEGFRNFRRQVKKRIVRRMEELGIVSELSYRSYLEAHPDEWEVLRKLCRVTISRFYRDRGVFERLERDVFPRLIEGARKRGASVLLAWCAGCAGGEEAYTLAILWQVRITPLAAGMTLRILATDFDTRELERARQAEYPEGALRELPHDLRSAAFDEEDGTCTLAPRFRDTIEFVRSDLAREMPEGPFDLILCRNVAFTYFDSALQRHVAACLTERLEPGGVLVIGKHETMVDTSERLVVLFPGENMYTRSPAGELG